MRNALLVPKTHSNSSFINTLVQDVVKTQDCYLQDISLFEIMIRLRLALEQKLTIDYGYTGELAEGMSYPEGWDDRICSFFQAISLTQYMTPNFEQDIRDGRLIESESLTNTSTSKLFAPGLTLNKISKGHDSFYRAIAASTTLDSISIKNAVKNILTYQFVDDLPINLKSKIPSQQAAQDYCKQITAGQWLGDVEIKLAMFALQKAILIVHPNGKIDNIESLKIYPKDPIYIADTWHDHYDAVVKSSELTTDEVIALLSRNTKQTVPESALILYGCNASTKGLNWYAISGCLMVLLFKENYLQAIPGQEVQFELMKQAFLNFYFSSSDNLTTGTSVHLTPAKALKTLFESRNQHALTAMDAIFYLKFSSIYTYDSRRANELKKEIALFMHAYQPSSNALTDLAYLDAYIGIAPDQNIIGTMHKESKFRSALRRGSIEQIKCILDSAQVYPELTPTIQISHLKTLYPRSGNLESNQYWINDLAFAVLERSEAVPLMFDFLDKQSKQDCFNILYARSGIGSRILLFMVEKNEPTLVQLFLTFAQKKLELSPEEICDAFILDQDKEGANALYYATCNNNKKEVLNLLKAVLLSTNVERLNPATWSSLYQAQICWMQGQGWPNGPCVRVFVDALIMHAKINNNIDSLTMAFQVLNWAPDGLVHPDDYLRRLNESSLLLTTIAIHPVLSTLVSEMLDKLSEEQKMNFYIDCENPYILKLLQSKVTNEDCLELMRLIEKPCLELEDEEDWCVVESKDDDTCNSHMTSPGGIAFFRRDDPEPEGKDDAYCDKKRLR